MDSAEQAALSPKNGAGTAVSTGDAAAGNSNGNLRYYNAHKLAGDGKSAYGARDVILTPNRHFDHLPVNTSISSILMPSDVHDTGK